MQIRECSGKTHHVCVVWIMAVMVVVVVVVVVGWEVDFIGKITHGHNTSHLTRTNPLILIKNKTQICKNRGTRTTRMGN